MKTLILSAFGRFGSYKANSTELIANRLHSTELSGSTIHSRIFACAIPEDDRGLLLFDLARKTQASGIICLGMASDKKGLCVETVARNAIDSKYCDPHINGTAIDPDMPYDAEVAADLAPWNIDAFGAECERQDVGTVEVSSDPGAFCCNHLLFQLRALQLRRPETAIPIIYLHIPCSEEAVTDLEGHRSAGKITMPIEKVIEGIGILIKNASLA